MLTPTKSTGNGGVYIGTVTRVDADGAYVEVESLAAGFEYGPAHYPASLAGDGMTSAEGSHTHTGAPAGAHGHGATLDGDHGHGTSPDIAGAHQHETDITAPHTHPLDTVPNHRHHVPGGPLSPGDLVACAFINGGRDELVVLVRVV